MVRAGRSANCSCVHKLMVCYMYSFVRGQSCLHAPARKGKAFIFQHLVRPRMCRQTLHVRYPAQLTQMLQSPAGRV